MYICIERKLTKQKKIQFTGKTTTTIYEIWFGFKCDVQNLHSVFYVT